MYSFGAAVGCVRFPPIVGYGGSHMGSCAIRHGGLHGHERAGPFPRHEVQGVGWSASLCST